MARFISGNGARDEDGPGEGGGEVSGLGEGGL